MALCAEEDCGLALVTGEAGIGKTRLLEEMTERAAGLGQLTFVGRASEYECELPFGLVIDAVDPYLESLDSRAFERLARDEMGELAGVFPALRGLGNAVREPSSATERFRVHTAVRELLERLAARQPILFVLEDLHWADGASLELITHLIRRAPQAAVTVALSFRSGQVDAVVLKSLEDLRPDVPLVELKLGPLDLEESSRLLRSPERSRLETLQRESGGNPFYLLQLADVQVDRPEASAARPPQSEVPAAVSAAIERELSALSTGVQEIVELAAVIGDPFEIELVHAIAGDSDGEVNRALDDLGSRRLIKSADSPRRFAFRHPLVRAAIYEGAAPGTVIASHRAIAEVLASRGTPSPIIAPHVERCGQHGDAEAIELLREAAREVAAQAPTSAARWLCAAADLLPADAPAETRLALTTELAGAQAAAGDLKNARSAFVESIELSGGSREMKTALTVACAAVEQLIGHGRDAKARLGAALVALGDEISEQSVSLMIALSANGLYLAEYDEMLAWARRAVEAAEALDSPPLRAAASASLTMGAALTGDWEGGLEQRQRASGLIEALSDDQLAERIDSIGSLAGAEIFLDHFSDSCTHAERGLRVARASGQSEFVPVLNASLGSSLWLLGDVTRSAEVLDAAVEAARLTRNPLTIAWASFNRAYGALMAGDVVAAREHGEEGVRLAPEIDSGLVSAHAAIHGATLLELGEPDRAVDLLVTWGGGEELNLIPTGGWRATYLETLTLCWLALGRQDAATVASRRCRAEAESIQLALTSLMANRAAASVALSQGRADEASSLALSAVAASEDLGARSIKATSQVLAGRCLLATGAPDQAATQLEGAATEYEGMGAPRYRDQAEAFLRKTGRHVARKTRRGRADGSGVETLTGRELEVAELIRDRRTNKEIAADLFLSLRTVETHVRNTLRKLDVASRVEIARALEKSQPPV